MKRKKCKIWIHIQVSVLIISLTSILMNCTKDKPVITGPEPTEYPPKIEDFFANRYTVDTGDSVKLQVIATDQNGDSLQYNYRYIGGTITDPTSPVTNWIAPISPQDTGKYTITVIVNDGKSLPAKDSVTISVTLGNNPPNIEAFSASPDTVVKPGGSVELQVIATDPDGDSLKYSYSQTGGIITNPYSPVTNWIAPQIEGEYTITVTVSDGKLSAKKSVKIHVKNNPPEINKFEANPDTVEPSGSVELKVDATDPDGDSLEYDYDLTDGSITDPNSPVTNWIAPQIEGEYTITVTVSDGKLSDKDSVTITVQIQHQVIKIVKPQHGGLVSRITTVEGTTQKLPQGAEIWIFIHPKNDIIYKQDDPGIVMADGSWKSHGCVFGNEWDVRKIFDLWAQWEKGDGTIIISDKITLTREYEDTTKYGFEKSKMGWNENIYNNTKAIQSVAQTSEEAFLGSGSLKMTVELIGNDTSNSQGEAYVDLRHNPPPGVTAPVDLLGVEISAWIYAPEMQKDEESKENYFQIFVKDSKWRSEYGTATYVKNIVSPNWFKITLTPSITTPPDGSMDPGFDPTDIILMGIKVATQSDSTYHYTDPIYLDAFNW